MKLNRFVISVVMLTCSLHVMAGDSLDTEKSKFEQRLERKQNAWLSLIPTHFVIQNAGNMGTLSAGIGWSYGKSTTPRGQSGQRPSRVTTYLGRLTCRRLQERFPKTAGSLSR